MTNTCATCKHWLDESGWGLRDGWQLCGAINRWDETPDEVAGIAAYEFDGCGFLTRANFGCTLHQELTP